MLRQGTQNSFIQNRVSMPTEKSHAELVSNVASQIKARAFFSARVAEAHILDRLRDVSDRYSRGEMGLGEARNILKDFLRGQGMDPHQAGMRNLASTGRLNLILRQNAAMAKAAGDWKRMHDPDQMAVFPYVRYHSRGDGRTRSSHDALDGKIFDKNDPFLKTHTPPWEFNCRCWLEEITAKEAGKDVQPMTAPENVHVDSESGFVFDPAEGLGTFDPELIKNADTREKIVRTMEEQYGCVYEAKRLKVVREEKPVELKFHPKEEKELNAAFKPKAVPALNPKGKAAPPAVIRVRDQQQDVRSSWNPETDEFSVSPDVCSKILRVKKRCETNRQDTLKFTDIDLLRSFLHDMNHRRCDPNVGAEGTHLRFITELANEEYTRMHLKELLELQGFHDIPDNLIEQIQNNGTGYARNINSLRKLASLVDGNDSQYRQFMCELQLMDGTQKEQMFWNFWEQHLKKRGIDDKLIQKKYIVDGSSSLWKTLKEMQEK